MGMELAPFALELLENVRCLPGGVLPPLVTPVCVGDHGGRDPPCGVGPGEDTSDDAPLVTGYGRCCPCPASFRRNSTKRLEKDYSQFSFRNSLHNSRGKKTPTSFIAASSSALGSSPRRDLPFAGVPFAPPPGAGPMRCNPALARSVSSHCRIVAKSDSISNRFESARCVVRNERRIFVTSLRSTLSLEAFLRSRRSASVRCSLFTTASWRSLAITPFFSFISRDSASEREASVLTSPRRVSALAQRSLYSDNEVAAARSCDSSSSVAWRSSPSLAGYQHTASCSSRWNGRWDRVGGVGE